RRPGDTPRGGAALDARPRRGGGRGAGPPRRGGKKPRRDRPPTRATATGKAQPARAISAPVIADAPGRGSRVEKSKAAATSATSCLGEMTADVARSCMRPPSATALYCDLRQLGATLPVRPRLQQES